MLESLHRYVESYFAYSRSAVDLSKYDSPNAGDRHFQNQLIKLRYVDNEWRKVRKNGVVYWSIPVHVTQVHDDLVDEHRERWISYSELNSLLSGFPLFTFNKWCYMLFFHEINFSIIPGRRERGREIGRQIYQWFYPYRFHEIIIISLIKHILIRNGSIYRR